MCRYAIYKKTVVLHACGCIGRFTASNSKPARSLIRHLPLSTTANRLTTVLSNNSMCASMFDIMPHWVVVSTK